MQVDTELQKTWDNLVEKSSNPSIYSTYDYISSSVNVFLFKTIDQAFLLVIKNKENNEVIGIFPLCISVHKIYNKHPKYIEHIIGTHNSDVDKPYPILHKDYEKECWSLFCEYFSTVDTDWQGIEYDELMLDSSFFDVSKKYFSLPKFERKIEKGPLSPIVNLQGTWLDFWNSHRNLRKKYKRMKNRLGENFSYQVFHKPEDMEKCIEYYINTELKSWKSGMGISDSEGQKFYKIFLNKIAYKNQAFFGILFDKKNPVAVELNYVYKDMVYFAQGTFDPKYKNLSPGTVSTSMFIEYFFEKGYSKGDFLAGYADYVNPLASEILSTNHISIYKINIVYLYQLVYRFIARVKAFIRVKILRKKSKWN